VLAKKLKQSITARNWTTAELAEKSGVNKRTLDNWLYIENSNPEVRDFMKVAAELGVSMEYLLTGKDAGGLTVEENLLLSAFRKIPRQRRRLLLRIAEVIRDDLTR
jgi:transcriptional regulator with XRE-family HTH domain